MAYSELFKNYSDIRNFMRRFYVYGFEKRQDFTAKSSRSYDDNRRRLDSWLEDYMSFKSEADGRAYRISFDSSSISHNPLYKSWKAKSFTSMDITLHFYLLDILADGKAYSAAELLELLSGRYFNCFDNRLRQPDESTVRNKLNEYTALGMLRLVKQGRRNLYCLARDEVNWRSWQLACAFFSEAAPLGEVGSYLLDKFAEDCEAFAFKHHFILYTMDSRLLFELLEAMNSRQSVTLYRCDKDGSSIPQYVCPLKIYCSTRTGRQYLLSYSYAARKLLFNRLDHIESIEVKRAEGRYEEFLQLGKEVAPHIWGAGMLRTDWLEEISFTVEAAADEQFIVQRLEREKRCGTVQQLDAEHYCFSAAVYDARELLPWIRTFIGRITAFSCSNEEIERIFYDDLEQTAAYYLQEVQADGEK